MIKPLLEGFDPARRPLLFLRGILAWRACQRRVELNCPNLAMGYVGMSNLRAHISQINFCPTRLSPSTFR
jgi:hypothetical protein